MGHVDDGSHCDYDSGVCVGGVCYDMPDYFVGTQPPVKSFITTSPVVTRKPGIATTRPATTISTRVPFTEPETARSTESQCHLQQFLNNVLDTLKPSNT